MKTRTLFVEDEQWGVVPYFYELEKKDFECILVRDADAAVQKLQSKPFDLISMDIMFPPGQILGEDIPPIQAGMRLLEMIRNGKIASCEPDIKVIILTALIDNEIETRIKKLGVNAYLKKPIDFEKVIATFNILKNQIKKDN